MASVTSKMPFQLGEVTPANIQQLKTINTHTLPVRYTDKFYRELIDRYGSDFMRFAFWNGFAVAAVCARLEKVEESGDNNKLYIMTINVLAPYRRRGIGNLLFNFNFMGSSRLTSIYVYGRHAQRYAELSGQ